MIENEITLLERKNANTILFIYDNSVSTFDTFEFIKRVKFKHFYRINYNISINVLFYSLT